MQKFSILVPLAEGCEEIEAIVPIDIWRRAGYVVTTAALQPGPVQAARQTTHLADTLLAEVIDRSFDLIYLPGGRPGADHLAAHQPLLQRLQRQVLENRWLAAICAAPLALQAAGLLDGKHFTCHPSVVADLGDKHPQNSRLVMDGKLLTACAAGAAYELALTLIRLVDGEAAVHAVNQGLLCHPALLVS